ncbi:YitT family protein [Salinibacterium sp. dk5596]|uniref:membrane protein YczE n=1 Tax=unclassified Salinibacterium TaxID=2632331 RepID=UPI00351A119C
MTRRIVQLLLGLFFYGIAIAMMLRAGLGATPWDVLSQGTSGQTGIQFGLVTVLISGVVLLLWIPIRQKPGIGTVLNAVLVGPSADLGLLMIATPEQLWAQVLLFAGGLCLLALATGLYIGARFGPGPRDGLMTGIHARTGWPIWAVRTGLEGSVLLIGWLLGGVVGFGTLAFALLIGPMVGVTIPLLTAPERRADATGPSSPQPHAEAPVDTAGIPNTAVLAERIADGAAPVIDPTPTSPTPLGAPS